MTVVISDQERGLIGFGDLEDVMDTPDLVPEFDVAALRDAMRDIHAWDCGKPAIVFNAALAVLDRQVAALLGRLLDHPERLTPTETL